MSKTDSKILYGIAILLMIFHHVFMNPSSLGIECYEITHLFAWFGKICVAIYAFISGYGLMASFSAEYENVMKKFISEYKKVIKRIITFYFCYWLMFVLFVPGYLFFSNRNFDIKEYIMNFWGLSFTYNGAWWYVKQYVIMLFIFPTVAIICTRIRKLKGYLPEILFAVVTIIMFIMFYSDFIFLKKIANSVFITYILIFVEGIIFQKSVFFDKLVCILQRKCLVSLAVGCICIVTRIVVSKGPAYCLVDIVMIAPFCISICALVKKVRVNNIFSYFGEFSIYMWLTHCFFINPAIRCIYGNNVKNNFLVYLFVFVSAFISSFCLRKVEFTIKILMKQCRAEKKLLD